MTTQKPHTILYNLGAILTLGITFINSSGYFHPSHIVDISSDELNKSEKNEDEHQNNQSSSWRFEGSIAYLAEL